MNDVNFTNKPEKTISVLTAGGYQTEKEAAAAFDSAFTNCNGLQYFDLHSEVTGSYLATLLARKPKEKCRIDRILTPKQTARDAGWIDGPVGVEIKRSGEKLGPVFNQCIDYLNAAFCIRGVHLVLKQIFVWPLDPVGGFPDSILTSNRIGPVHQKGPRLLFRMAGTNSIVLSRHEVSFKHVNVGTGIGSR